jgi:zinc finger SWIM domain-containing protein 3
VIALDYDTEQWYVKDFIDEHNHPMIDADLSCFLRSHRKITDEQKAEIVHLQISGIWKHQIVDTMLKRYGGMISLDLQQRTCTISANTISCRHSPAVMLKQSSIT